MLNLVSNCTSETLQKKMKVALLFLLILTFLLLSDVSGQAVHKRKRRKSKKVKKSKPINPDEPEEVTYSSEGELQQKLKQIKQQKQSEGYSEEEIIENRELLAKLKSEEVGLVKDVYRAALNFGDYSTQKAMALNRLGRNVYSQRRFAEALNISREIVKLHEQADGVEHLNTGQALNNLGSSLYRLQHPIECGLVMQRALYIFLRQYDNGSKEIMMHRAKMLTFQIRGAETSSGLSYDDFLDEMDEMDPEIGIEGELLTPTKTASAGSISSDSTEF